MVPQIASQKRGRNSSRAVQQIAAGPHPKMWQAECSCPEQLDEGFSEGFPAGTRANLAFHGKCLFQSLGKPAVLLPAASSVYFPGQPIKELKWFLRLHHVCNRLSAVQQVAAGPHPQMWQAECSCPEQQLDQGCSEGLGKPSVLFLPHAMSACLAFMFVDLRIE